MIGSLVAVSYELCFFVRHPYLCCGGLWAEGAQKFPPFCDPNRVGALILVPVRNCGGYLRPVCEYLSLLGYFGRGLIYGGRSFGLY